MDFKIKDFSKISGIPASSLRFFEQHGFSGLERDDNGYRKYSILDAYRINEFNSLTAQGFSLKEAAERTACGYPVDRYCEELKEKAGRFEAELELLQKKIVWNRQLVEIYENFEELENTAVPAQLPEFVFLPCTEGEDPTPSLKVGRELSQLVEILPASVYAARWERDGRLQLGMAAPKKFAQKHGVDTSRMETVPGGEFYAVLLRRFNEKEKPEELVLDGHAYKLSEIQYPIYGIYLMVDTDKYGEDAQIVLIRK